MNELELATTDEILKELLSRFENAVFCGVKLPIGEQQAVVGQWRGNALTCVGLAQSIAQSALLECQFDDTDVEEDEE